MARYYRMPYTKLFIAAMIVATLALIVGDRGRYVAPRVRLFAGHLFRPGQSGVQAIPMRLSGGGMPQGRRDVHGQSGGEAELAAMESAMAQQAAQIESLNMRLADVTQLRLALPAVPLRIVPSSVLSHGYLSPEKGMTINRGRKQGLAERHWVLDGDNLLAGGRRHGIDNQNAVVDTTGIVGIVSQVGDNISVVRPITSPDVCLAASVVHWDAVRQKWLAVPGVGMVRGAGDGKHLRLDDMRVDLDIRPGDYVVTANHGMGVGVMANLVIGRVVSVSRSRADMLHTIVVEPRSKFSELDRVYVLAPDKSG